MINPQPIRQRLWFEEISEYLEVDPREVVLCAGKGERRLEEEDAGVQNKRQEFKKRYMSSNATSLLEKIQTADPTTFSDSERSESWREYIFSCINGERKAFRRIAFYEELIQCVIRPLMKFKEGLTLVDYGSGSSLLTRMVAEDFGANVRTLSVDVCRPAVQFSVTRNRLFNPNAEGIVIENVMEGLSVKNADLILAYCVFEHLPNSTQQIASLIEALLPGGILVENYAGHPSETPHKSDTFSSYQSRDWNLKMLSQKMVLLHGKFPAPDKHGTLKASTTVRYWIKPGYNNTLFRNLQTHLKRHHSFFARLTRRLQLFLGYA